MIEALVFGLPTAIYLLVRRRRPDAAAVMGLGLPARRTDWWLGLALAAGGVLLGWLSTILVPSEVLHGPGTTGRITTLAAGLLVAPRSWARSAR